MVVLYTASKIYLNNFTFNKNINSRKFLCIENKKTIKSIIRLERFNKKNSYRFLFLISFQFFFIPLNRNIFARVCVNSMTPENEYNYNYLTSKTLNISTVIHCYFIFENN